MRAFFKQHQLAIFIVAIDIILVLVLILLNVIKSSKNAILDILVTPTDATVLVDGRQYNNGSYKFFPGPVEIQIKKDGFTTKTLSLNLAANHTAKLYTYLLTEDGSLEYYSTHSEDLYVLKQVSDSSITNYVSKLSIKDILPYKYAVTDASGKLIRFFIDVDTKDCPSSFCLQAVNYRNSSKEFIQQTFLEKTGYNLNDYETYYY